MEIWRLLVQQLNCGSETVEEQVNVKKEEGRGG